MPNLATLAEAKDHLRIDSEADDSWLSTWIPIVSQAVISWLKDENRIYVPELDADGNPLLDSEGEWVPLLDSDGEPEIAPLVRGAALIELASQYRFREGEGKDNAVTPDAGWGYVLNKASTAILAGIRRPTVAR